MSDADERRAEAARWLAIADQDMAAARLCASSSPLLPAVAGYHCQQAVEKIVKALLVAAGIPFPKTHDLAALNALAIPKYPALAAVLGAHWNRSPFGDSPTDIRRKKRATRRRPSQRLRRAWSK